MVWLPIGNKDYGFTDARPSGRVFAVTGDYASLARNHCAATALTNSVNLLQSADSRRNDERATDMQAIFREVHAIVGNGPVLHLQNKANQYLRQAGLPYVCEQVDRHLTETSPARLVRIAQESLRANRPVALLVAASPIRWHWVLALPDSIGRAPTLQDGASSLPDGSRSPQDHMQNAAFRISDSWHARQTYRYAPDQGSRLMAVALFRPHENL